MTGLGIGSSALGGSNTNLSTTNGDLRMSGTDLSKKSSSDLEKGKFNSPVASRYIEQKKLIFSRKL